MVPYDLAILSPAAHCKCNHDENKINLIKLNSDLDDQGLVEQEAARRRLHEENQATFVYKIFYIRRNW